MSSQDKVFMAVSAIAIISFIVWFKESSEKYQNTKDRMVDKCESLCLPYVPNKSYRFKDGDPVEDCICDSSLERPTK